MVPNKKYIHDEGLYQSLNHLVHQDSLFVARKQQEEIWILYYHFPQGIHLIWRKFLNGAQPLDNDVKINM